MKSFHLHLTRFVTLFLTNAPTYVHSVLLGNLQMLEGITVVVSLHQHYNTWNAWLLDIRIYQLGIKKGLY